MPRVRRAGGWYRGPMSDPTERPPEGSGVILLDATGRVLLQQRDDDVPPAGYGRWAIPGGGREGDETPRETALREFEEETAIRLGRIRFFATYDARRDFEQPAASGPRHLHIFFADDTVDPDRIEVHEGLDFRFWTPEEAANLPMNPAARRMLNDFFASDYYRGHLALNAPFRQGVSVIEIDRWGSVLLQLRDADLPPERFPGVWSLPGGLIEPGESPDAAALREFEEETGHLLEHLKLYRVFRAGEPDAPPIELDVLHVYYFDADLPETLIEVNEGQAFRYFSRAAIADLEMPVHIREVLERFFVSPAYKAMFH